MLTLRSSRSLTTAAVALLVGLSGPALAQDAELVGTPALAGTTSAVTGVLSVRETGPLERTLRLSLTNAETGEPVTAFDVELTQELHVIATDSAFSTFVHEHAEAAEPDGSLQVVMPFPKPGLYHVYTDAVPTGLGQQVLRFDLQVGEDQGASVELPEAQGGDVLSASAGPYQVELDVSGLRAGEESEVTLQILKDGQPATDLAPYLGVPAHVVFIATDDLAYVHAHASPSDGTGAHGSAGHGDHGSAEMTADMQHGTETADHGGHGAGDEPAEMQHSMQAGHGGHGAPAEETQHGPEAQGHDAHGSETTDETVPASLRVMVTPPAPGAYGVWIQFIGGGEVQTAPFMIAVD